MGHRAIVVIGLVLAACGPTGPRTPLLTYPDVIAACYAGGEQGITADLVADPTYGTTFAGRPVMWPHGYTARLAGAEVEVLDASGNVKAKTGRTYHLSYAPPPENLKPSNAFVAAAGCSYPWDLVDCSADPGNQYCRPD